MAIGEKAETANATTAVEVTTTISTTRSFSIERSDDDLINLDDNSIGSTHEQRIRMDPSADLTDTVALVSEQETRRNDLSPHATHDGHSCFY